MKISFGFYADVLACEIVLRFNFFRLFTIADKVKEQRFD